LNQKAKTDARGGGEDVPMADRTGHWRKIYADKAEDEVSWYQSSPAASLALIETAGLGPDCPIIDVGGGASRLVDILLERGYTDVAVLDIADTAIGQARNRLGPRAASVQWITADITAWKPEKPYDLWHDRAVFHFLTAKAERDAYRAVLENALAPGGQVIIGTFDLDGPEQCSGLPVVRYDAESLGRELGPAFRLAEHRREDHTTPAGVVQHFQFCRFTRA